MSIEKARLGVTRVKGHCNEAGQRRNDPAGGFISATRANKHTTVHQHPGLLYDLYIHTAGRCRLELLRQTHIHTQQEWSSGRQISQRKKDNITARVKCASQGRTVWACQCGWLAVPSALTCATTQYLQMCLRVNK